MIPLVIYHANCRDGFTAAWIARKKLGERCECIPAQYGQEPPDVAGRDVYILDFSYKRDVMRQILSSADRVVVLDHHITAKDDLAGLTEEFVLPPKSIQFDMEKSGARLAWEFFYPEHQASRLVRYVEDRDLWRYCLASSKQVAACIESHEMTWSRWDWLASQLESCSGFASAVNEGEAIERLKNNLVDQIVRGAREVKILGHIVLEANTSVLFSEVAGKLAEGRPFGAAWFQRVDGVKVYSLRSSDVGVDVSEVAKKLGGGGHRNAAGFQIY